MEQRGDRLFARIILTCGAAVILTVVAGAITLTVASAPSIKAFGLKFIIDPSWDPLGEKFGALVFLVGTMVTSLLSLAITTPMALAISLFITEYAPRGLRQPVSHMVELLAAIPSVIYGLWGIFFLVPLVRRLELAIGQPPYGVGAFTASLVLAIMILPYAVSVARSAISMVPHELKEGGYALGATRWEVVRHVILPYAKSGIVAGLLLALGRALGETMAVTMVIGNRNALLRTIFDPTNTMASVIANEFTEATSDLHLAALTEIGLLLFGVTLLVNLAGRWVMNRLSVGKTP